ncbi:MAG: TIM barrel protein [Clostridia bacterium]|nr:TIM barrel protein [Clostridia bacterium]
MGKVKIYGFADEASPRIDGQIAALVRNRMDGLEIRNVDGENVSDISLEKAREVRRKLEAAGLVVWSVGSPIGKIDIARDDFPSHLDKLRHTLEVAEVLGARRIRIFSFYIPVGDDPAAWRGEVLDRLNRMADLAEGTGIRLCHENEKGIYGDNAARCLDIHRAEPRLAGVFDPANFIQTGQDVAAAWEALKPYVDYMHVKDALADGSVVPAGRGIGSLAEILGDYLAGGGTALTLEPHLKVFDGLSALERVGGASRVGGYAYASGDAAFDAAAAALRELLPGD